ncbi:MAG: nucleotidyltransferase domain-containing protein [Oligoflexia bacterium]|nr:nucleotidyltransferase domain-containing protein [Oligoflexia bacterium]
MIRLTDQEISSITEVFSKYVQTPSTLYLYGSRTDIDALGGDIDLLLVVPDTKKKQQLLSLHLDILVDLKQQIGEQKIDLLIKYEKELEVDPFLLSIKQQLQVICNW